MLDGYRSCMRKLARWYLSVRGWTFVGEMPDEPKLVIIGYPHTSNWDFVAFLGVVGHLGIKVKYLMKEGVFKWPFSIMFERLGGVRVGGHKGSLVTDAVRAFDERDEMFLVIAPEGTRASGSKWHTGFWRIADAADVPILLGFVDGPTKTMGVGPAIPTGGGIEAWLAEAGEFYGDKRGWKPENAGPIEV